MLHYYHPLPLSFYYTNYIFIDYKTINTVLELLFSLLPFILKYRKDLQTKTQLCCFTMISCLPMASSYCISSIHFSLIIFNISCRASILVMNSLHFYFFGNVLISPFLKDSFIWYWIFGWQSISNISSSYFLISWFLMRFQLLMLKISYDKLFFPCWLQDFFCFVSQQHDYDVSRYASLWIYCVWN